MKLSIILAIFVSVLSFCSASEPDVITKATSDTVQTVSTPSEPIADGSKKEIDSYAHFRPEHREILQKWLKTKKNLRPAVEETDNWMFKKEKYRDEESYRKNFEGNMKMVRDSVGENGYQYYSVGDLNHDGREDFAVLLVDARRRKDDGDFFALAIFNAPFSRGQSPAYYEENLRGISNSYIVYNTVMENYLFLGKFESDVYCATYYPRGKTYYFKDCLDE